MIYQNGSTVRRPLAWLLYIYLMYMIHDVIITAQRSADRGIDMIEDQILMIPIYVYIRLISFALDVHAHLIIIRDIIMHVTSNMGWLQLVGSLKTQVSFAKFFCLFCKTLL